ncbi:MAG: peptide deformylase [Acidobacteria bacterium]|nr:peptide deformylase [Acidobacteriota bacterium]
MIRPIVRYGDEVLRRRAEDVAELTAEVRSLIDDMVETMYAAPGVGLAAPQVGVPLRVFVADPSVGRNVDDLVVLVNPAVVEKEGVQSEEEGCLSVPGFAAKVRRPSRLVVRGLDRDGETIEVEGTGLLARALQHELDHLDGSLFLDRLRGLRRELIVRKIHKLQRTGKW